MKTQVSYYFATDASTGAEINGILPDDLALTELLSFIKSHNKAYINCGIIWVELLRINQTPDGIDALYEDGDWAVWCNYDNEPITEDNAEIGGNWEYAIEAVRKAIL